MKNSSLFFLSEKFQFLEVNFTIYLNRRVFIIYSNFFPFGVDTFSEGKSCAANRKSQKFSPLYKMAESLQCVSSSLK